MSERLRVYMDACCFIDMAKQRMSVPVTAARASHATCCRKFLDAARVKEAIIYTSTFTVVECVKVVDDTIPGGRLVDDERVKTLFLGMLMSGKSGVTPVTANPSIIERARDLRWNNAITCKPIDAVHVATALAMKCTHYLTTDDNLGTENIKKIALMGLTICTGDQAISLLPDEFRQTSIPLTHAATPASKDEKPSTGAPAAS